VKKALATKVNRGKLMKRAEQRKREKKRL